MRILASLAIICAISLLGTNARGDIIFSRGQIRLLATGLDSRLESNPNNGPVYLDFEGGVNLYDTASVTSYGYGYGGGGLGLAAFTSNAYLRTNNGDLGIRIEGTGQGGWAYSPSGGGDAWVSWDDGLSLFWRGSGDTPALPYTDLNFHFVLEGALTTSIGGITGQSSWIDSSASMNARLGSQAVSYTVNKNAVFNPTGQDQTIFPTFDANVSLDPNGRATYSYSLGVATQSSFGFGLADFGNTMTLDAITFPDGTTPESHGWGIQFDSGIQSPNAVPEPSSIVLFSLAALGVAVRRKRGITMA